MNEQPIFTNFKQNTNIEKEKKQIEYDQESKRKMIVLQFFSTTTTTTHIYSRILSSSFFCWKIFLWYKQNGHIIYEHHLFLFFTLLFVYLCWSWNSLTTATTTTTTTITDHHHFIVMIVVLFLFFFSSRRRKYPNQK